MPRATLFESNWKNVVTLKPEHDSFMSWSFSNRTGSFAD